jgi:hypothetical protein
MMTAKILRGVTFSLSSGTEIRKTKTGALWHTALFPAREVLPRLRYHVYVDPKMMTPRIAPHLVYAAHVNAPGA